MVKKINLLVEGATEVEAAGTVAKVLPDIASAGRTEKNNNINKN
jgi:ATP phosphoribosyltransferase